MNNVGKLISMNPMPKPISDRLKQAIFTGAIKIDYSDYTFVSVFPPRPTSLTDEQWLVLRNNLDQCEMELRGMGIIRKPDNSAVSTEVKA